MPGGAKFFFGERLAVEGQGDFEVQHGISPHAGGLLITDAHTDLGARRALGPPPIGHADDDAAGLKNGKVLQEAIGLVRGPGERLVDRLGLHELAGQRAGFRGPLDGRQERHELLAVAGAGVFLQSAAQG